MRAPFFTRRTVDPATGCWLWTGAKDPKGYGNVWHEGRSDKAHRVAFRLTKGPIPPGMMVLHACDRPSCINPDHLHAGTAKQNTREMIERGRARLDGRRGKPIPAERRARGDRHGSRTKPDAVARGERSGNAKLTDAIVREMRTARTAGATTVALAARYGVHNSVASRVLAGRSWKHVEGT